MKTVPLALTASASAALGPRPRADHDVPSQRITPLAWTVPAPDSTPPAIRSPVGVTARESTRPKTPPASDCHELPFQRATLPSSGSEPPMIRSLPSTTMERTVPLGAPIAFHCDVFGS